MSFYSLWQHYISMTSQPLANSDRGVMRIVGIAELMRLPRLSPVLSHSLRHSLFAIVAPPTSRRRSLHLLFLFSLSLSFFFFSLLPLFKLLSSPLFSFHPPLSAACSSFSHIRAPLPAPLFEILYHFPSLCHNTLSK